MTLSKHDKEYVVLAKGAKALPTHDREKIVSCLKMYNLVELCVGAIPNPYERVFDKIANWHVPSVPNEYSSSNYESPIYQNCLDELFLGYSYASVVLKVV